MTDKTSVFIAIYLKNKVCTKFKKVTYNIHISQSTPHPQQRSGSSAIFKVFSVTFLTGVASSASQREQPAERVLDGAITRQT